MKQRRCAGKPAEITFTSDFHELVTGDLRPGATLLLRYDPGRIVPAGQRYRFGDPDQPVRAHVQFSPGAPPLDVRLLSPAGIVPCPDVDPTGQGSMLSALLAVPADADLLIVWFSYESAASTILYDSDYGANYRFGFPCLEIEVAQANVAAHADGSADRFDVVIRAAADVEDVLVQYVLVADPACAEHDLPLRRTGPDAAHPDATAWAASADIPRHATIRFRVCYWIGGRRLIEDDGGAWYLAPEAQPDRLPSPSPAVLAAAAAWR